MDKSEYLKSISCIFKDWIPVKSESEITYTKKAQRIICNEDIMIAVILVFKGFSMLFVIDFFKSSISEGILIKKSKLDFL